MKLVILAFHYNFYEAVANVFFDFSSLGKLFRNCNESVNKLINTVVLNLTKKKREH